MSIQEIALALRSPWVRLSALTSVALVVSSVLLGAHRYHGDTEERAHILALTEREWLGQDPKAPHPANHFGRWIQKPISPLSVLDRGAEDHLGQRQVLDAHVKTPLVGSVSEEDPGRALLGGFDLIWVTAILFPLLVIFCSHNAISGDKERGLLKLVLSAPISRSAVLAGKICGQLAAMTLVFGAPWLFGILVAVICGVPFSVEDALAILGMGLVALLHTLLFLFLCLAVSAGTATSRASLGWLLAIWLGVTFLAPRFAELLAGVIHPAPSALALEAAQAALPQTIEGERRHRYRRVLSALRKEHPEIPEDFGIRGHERGTAQSHWTVDPNGIFVTEANALINHRRDELLADATRAAKQQEKLALRLAKLSPNTWLFSASSAFAGTDVAHHQLFEASVNQYFLEFGQYFNALWAKNVREISDFSQAPRFEYRNEPLSARTPRALADLVVLLGATLLALLGAAWRMAQCDAR